MYHNQLNCGHSLVSFNYIYFDIFIVYVVPDPTVSLTIPNTQIVGQSLTLQCEVTTVRGITSRVDVIWRRNNITVHTTYVTVTATTRNNLIVYRDSYTISRLNKSDDNAMYECVVVIEVYPPVIAADTVTLSVTSECSPINIHMYIYDCIHT